jgi:DNA-binding PadR family transcriptional regulator
MAAVFRHGALRLYLLRLLGESPRHGYEVISLLEDRFLGLYAPSAGTVYPRLAKLESDGLVAHDDEEGRKVYRITEAGRAELAAHAEDLRDLEADITRSVAELARDVQSEVRASVRDLQAELKSAARDVRREARTQARAAGPGARTLDRTLSTLTRDVVAAAREADEAAVDAAVEILGRTRTEVLSVLTR